MGSTRHDRVGVVVPTHNRPELMRRAVASILDQDYDGPIEVVVVFDRAEPDVSIASNDPDRRVRVLANVHAAGLAGARNTGILSLQTEIVAFCDDDDVWIKHKLARQTQLLRDHPEVDFVTTAMTVDYGDRSTTRLAGRSRVTIADLARSRMAMLHSSSFLFRREAMVGERGFGLVDESMPRSMAEDWDLLIRAARQAPIAHVDEPLVRVLWGQSSYFNEAWADKNAAHQWLIERHPEIRADPKAIAHLHGKLAFGHAALGNRGEALRQARKALRANWREPRTPIAVLVAAGVSPKWVGSQLNRRGHGI